MYRNHFSNTNYQFGTSYGDKKRALGEITGSCLTHKHSDAIIRRYFFRDDRATCLRCCLFGSLFCHAVSRSGASVGSARGNSRNHAGAGCLQRTVTTERQLCSVVTIPEHSLRLDTRRPATQRLGSGCGRGHIWRTRASRRLGRMRCRWLEPNVRHANRRRWGGSGCYRWIRDRFVDRERSPLTQVCEFASADFGQSTFTLSGRVHTLPITAQRLPRAT